MTTVDNVELTAFVPIGPASRELLSYWNQDAQHAPRWVNCEPKVMERMILTTY